MAFKLVLGLICGLMTIVSSIGYASDGRKFCEPTKDQKADISKLVSVLGNEGWLKIWDKRDELQNIRSKIIDVHPLQFLAFIFSDKDLIPAMKNMKSSKLVWGKFKNPLFKTLTEEHKDKNVLPHMKKFAQMVKIDSALLLPAAEKEDWEKLLSILMEHAPRKGNPGRYNKM